MLGSLLDRKGGLKKYRSRKISQPDAENTFQAEQIAEIPEVLVSLVEEVKQSLKR